MRRMLTSFWKYMMTMKTARQKVLFMMAAIPATTRVWPDKHRRRQDGSGSAGMLVSIGKRTAACASMMDSLNRQSATKMEKKKQQSRMRGGRRVAKAAESRGGGRARAGDRKGS